MNLLGPKLPSSNVYEHLILGQISQTEASHSRIEPQGKIVDH
jgi:hypothetical protein